jgi:hypothetical protein
MKADWPTSWRGHERGLIAPPCPACGKKLRPDGAGWCDYSSTAMPWNHGWDGRCASCGHEVAVSVIGGHDGDRPQFHLKRVVTMRPEVSVHFIGLDLQKHYSGVRIRVEDSGEKVSEVFLSMGELKSLVRSLDDKANPLLRQIDYLVDVT